MNMNDIIGTIVNVHNLIAQISVHGDDCMKMAEAINLLRNLVSQLQQSKNNGETDN